MSKFTKALEKIQDEREPEKSGSKKDGNAFRVPSAEEAGDSRASLFDRVPTIKNTVPDNRVVMLRFPDSVLAEQYRMLRTSLKTELGRDHAKVILVSSSIHSEGKTVTAANLAVSLAENGDAKVALIDADLRRGKVADYLGLGKERAGLCDVLMDDLSPRQVMVRGPLKNLLIMTRGRSAAKPSELVSSNKFHVLMTELRTHFDYIIVDAPPIMSVADAGIIGREVDGTLFIIQVGRTPKTVVAHSHVLFKQAGVKMFGYVLTNVEYQSADYRYYGNYYYGEDIDKENSLKNRTRFQIKKAGFNFKNVEDKFNGWWEKSILKKHGKNGTNGKSALKEVDQP